MTEIIIKLKNQEELDLIVAALLTDAYMYDVTDKEISKKITALTDRLVRHDEEEEG